MTIRTALKRPVDFPPSDATDEQALLRNLPSLLAQAVDAWQDKNATEGDVEFPSGTYTASRAAELTVHETVIHCWDLAKATHQNFEVEEEVAKLVMHVSKGIDQARRGPGKPFGPIYPISPNAPLFDQAIAASGRNPDWSPPRSAPA